MNERKKDKFRIRSKAHSQLMPVYFHATQETGDNRNTVTDSAKRKKARDNHAKAQAKRGKRKGNKSRYRLHFSSAGYIETRERKPRNIKPFQVKTAFPVIGFSFNSNLSGEKLNRKPESIALVKRKFLAYCKKRKINNRFDIEGRFETDKLGVKFLAIYISERVKDPDSGIYSGWVYKSK